jgi:DNA-binding response OmpR family regulator
MKLMLIEDDETTVESIKLCLEIYEPSSTVTATSKGKEAIQLLKENNYDAVLIDLGLPDIDGIEVIEQMRIFHPDSCHCSERQAQSRGHR